MSWPDNNLIPQQISPCVCGLQAKDTVELLELLTQSDDVARCLTVMPLAQRAASAVSIHTLSTLRKLIRKVIKFQGCQNLVFQ